MLIFATGFDAMTGSLLRVDIRGRGGQPLAEAWAAGPVTYLGLSVHGLPQPVHRHRAGQPVGAGQHDRRHRAARRLDQPTASTYLRRQRATTSSRPSRDAVDAWVDHVNAVADRTMFPTCNSWYLGANIPGKPRVFMPLLGFPAYVDRCDQVVANGYEGFAFHSVTGAPIPA